MITHTNQSGPVHDFGAFGVSRNQYRWNEERGHWQFNDGVGPWARSGMLESCTTQQSGHEALLRMSFTPHEETVN